MSTEVKVTRWVADGVWTKALTNLFQTLIYNAAEIAQDYAPSDMGKLKQSLNPQAAGTVDGGAWPAWAKFGPKGDAARYGGYLNAGSYVRTWVPPVAALNRWVAMRDLDISGKALQASMRRNLGKTVYYHYIGNPNLSPVSAQHDAFGQRTQGWFNPSVVEAMERGPAQEAADKFKEEIERAWNGR